uniref:AlNc14C58G4328 protein n=1 Tax=Albugo laibachii Nc14 TaxID=890382 RepID=F0WCE8_9STRA|nr:AlNc14C58G4328 [Albugo laibachii Nc14]|eukprot:CCA18863.1 AlNc14C58G4328 [Albugo laibachii Nc14]
MLSADEQIEITAYASTQMSGSAIAATVNRSKNVVCSFLRDPDEYNRKNHCGRKPKASPTAVPRLFLFREASSGDKIARQLCEDLEQAVGVIHVQQLLRYAPYFSYEKRVSSPWRNGIWMDPMCASSTGVTSESLQG